MNNHYTLKIGIPNKKIRDKTSLKMTQPQRYVSILCLTDRIETKVHLNLEQKDGKKKEQGVIQ
jgi:hypothetical protein